MESNRTELTKIIAEQIKKYREIQGYSQKEFAERMGINPAALTRIESGEAGINSKTLQKFTNATGQSISFNQHNGDLKNVLDVCDYILFKSKKILGDDYDVTNMKLNKLLYYVQLGALSLLGRELFLNEFEAWKFGPVHPIVYYAFRNGSDLIIPTTEYHGRLSREEMQVTDKVLERYVQFSAFELRDRTHRELPWKNAQVRQDKKMTIGDMVLFIRKNNLF